MVWKRLMAALLICTLAVVPALPATASAAEFTPYDGMVQESVMDTAERIAVNRGLNQDYVFFRSSAETYLIVIGDLTYDTSITGTDCIVWQIVATDAGYDIGQLTFPEFSLNPHGRLIYSNLGEFPSVTPLTDILLTTLAILVAILIFMYIISGIFSFTMRCRGLP